MEDPLEPLQMPPIGRARNALFRRLLDLVAMPASRLAHQDRHMVGDILLEVLFHAEETDREMCARRLSNHREAPKRVLRYLGQCSFRVAQHVLEQNEGFDACDLREICMSGTQEHRKVIAERKLVPDSVCEYLAEFAEIPVVKVMLANNGAIMPEQAIDKLVARSRADESLCALLVERLETKPSQAMAMFWWSDSTTRRKILQRHAADRLEVIDTCRDVFELAAEENWADPVTRKAIQLIERRQRNRAAIDKSPYDSLEDAINASALEGLDSELAQEIGYLAGLKPVTAAKILTDKGGEGIAVLCKGTGVKRDFLPVLWAGLKRDLETETGEIDPDFARVAEIYEIMTVAKAQTTLRYWNWSLSSAFSPNALSSAIDDVPANEEASFSSPQRTARLVFGR
ncbi:DUF2336 domain-containing protein [Hyphomonas sp. UBA4494]|jgi:uncharacterized protein (DUF2336 family)|uniref:DUF2336 domain-containing protein n=1 Tax=Hyphomonas sp. UBA4494 TaxID=1946631 RepID=UPI0025BC6058|nr:DUF2336 domain-containing protein [Hyphomonas sp. UBA4494]